DSTLTESSASHASTTCPPASATPTASAPSVQPPGTFPAVLVSAPATTPEISSTAPGIPIDANTRNLVFTARCSGRIVENMAVRMTITSSSSTAGAGRARVVAHVAIVGGPLLLHYGPADFQFVASTGKIYDPVSTATAT